MENRWYYSHDGVWRGPVTKIELSRLVEHKIIISDTAIVSDGGAKSTAGQIIDILPSSGKGIVPPPSVVVPSSQAAETKPPLESTSARSSPPSSKFGNMIRLVLGISGLCVLAWAWWWYFHSDSPLLPDKAHRAQYLSALLKIIEAVSSHHAE